MENLKIRTLEKAYEDIKNEDPDTVLTKYALRKILMSGAVPTVRVGRLRLVDMTTLKNYLSGEEKNEH